MAGWSPWSQTLLIVVRIAVDEAFLVKQLHPLCVGTPDGVLTVFFKALVNVVVEHLDPIAR